MLGVPVSQESLIKVEKLMSHTARRRPKMGERRVENTAHEGTAAAFRALNGHQLARKRRANPTMGKLDDGTIEISSFGLGFGRFVVQITEWGMG